MKLFDRDTLGCYISMYRDRIASLWSSGLGPEKNNYTLAISGQAPKDLYNEHALSNVKRIRKCLNLFSVHLGRQMYPWEDARYIRH